MASLVALSGKSPLAICETWVQSLGREDPLVHPYSGIPLRKKGLNYCHTQRSGWISKPLSWMKKVRSKRKYNVWFHVYEILEKEKNYSVRKINGCQHQGLRENCCKGYREISGVNVMLHSVVLVVITRLCIFIKTHQIVHLKLVTLLCVNYNSMKTVIIIKN